MTPSILKESLPQFFLGRSSFGACQFETKENNIFNKPFFFKKNLPTNFCYASWKNSKKHQNMHFESLDE